MSGFDRYPKVLVVAGEPFNSRSATGITISNLFRGWPKDRIAQIYTAHNEPDLDVCEKYWKISNRDLKYYGLYNQYRSANEPVGASAASKAVDAQVQQASTSIRSPLIKKLLVSLVDLVPYHLSDVLIEQITNYDPDIIYSVLGNIRIVRLVDELSARFDIPVVPHFMDDWLATYSIDGGFLMTGLQKYIINIKTKSLISKIDFGFCIGKSMAEEYEIKFKKKFYAFMNPASLVSCNFKSNEIGRELVLTYVGGFHLGRHKNLLDVATAIVDLRKKGVNLVFNIYAPNNDIQAYSSMFHDMDGTRVVGSIPPESVKDVLALSDFALHVESFRKQYSVYTRLSVSTKIPQYFAAGLPVVAYGPRELASCKYVTDNKCGICIAKVGVMGIAEAISGLISDKAAQSEFSNNGIKTARFYHDELKERERFRDLLHRASV